MKYIPLITLLILTCIKTSGQNPVCPPGVYIADPSVHVWNDIMYLYGSTDESCNYWCSRKHDVMSTKDTRNWSIT